MRVHAKTKVHLLTYAPQKGLSGGITAVKPFMLVIARDTTHASQLMQSISSQLFGGRYAGKVIQADSGTLDGEGGGAEGVEIVQRLLRRCACVEIRPAGAARRVAGRRGHRFMLCKLLIKKRFSEIIPTCNSVQTGAAPCTYPAAD